VSGPVLELSDVSKDYQGLRPLRIERLVVGPADSVAIVGLDRVTAEVFVNLVTGATVPDRGEVKLFGRATSAIADSADWLAVVDRFGIVSERAVLLDGLSVIQNLSMPFTLEIEPPPDDVRVRAEELAREVELNESTWMRPLGELDRPSRARARLARALALDPGILLLEHPTADLPPADGVAFGRHVRQIAARRRAAIVAATADPAVAAAVATRVLTLDPATGRLAARRRGWFNRGPHSS
jgi:ABC-type transporter Mla maintaining outer membrane lipid asymmetry ATPase subunit MlaF